MAKAKNILGICVSNRKNGNSSIILNELLRPAVGAGCRIEILNLGALKILPCRGCLACARSCKCVLDDDLELVKGKIEEADAIALASPCYYLSAPSPLKAVMDRLASWAIGKRAGSTRRKYGVAVSVAGGAPIEFSLQRIYTSLFLGLFHCEITGQLTIGHSFGRGEILLAPSKLRSVSKLGENLLESVETGHCIKSPITECEGRLTCPNCLSDAFQVCDDGRLICPVCGVELSCVNGNVTQKGVSRFSVEGALEHRSHIIDNVIGGMLAGDEIGRRLKDYLESGVLPADDYEIDLNLAEVPGPPELAWDENAAAVLKAAIPAPLEESVWKAISKRAFQNGIHRVTRETVLQYLPKF